MVARLRALLLGYALYAAEIAFLAEFRVALVEVLADTLVPELLAVSLSLSSLPQPAAPKARRAARGESSDFCCLVQENTPLGFQVRVWNLAVSIPAEYHRG